MVVAIGAESVGRGIITGPESVGPESVGPESVGPESVGPESVSYTHLRAHETREDLVCRLLLEKKK